MAKKIVKVEQQEAQGLLNISNIPGLKAIPIRTRKFLQYDFDFTEEVYIPKFDHEALEDAIVKINIRIKQEDAHQLHWLKDMEESIRKHAFHLKPITPSIVRTRKVRNKKINADIGALDAIKFWLEDKKPNNALEILAIAEEIIRE